MLNKSLLVHDLLIKKLLKQTSEGIKGMIMELVFHDHNIQLPERSTGGRGIE
jgi:hypothetical protein